MSITFKKIECRSANCIPDTQIVVPILKRYVSFKDVLSSFVREDEVM